MASTSVAVLGAGMVGVSTALHLKHLGCNVVLFERNSAAGCETSFGNAGIIQSEAVEPYKFPLYGKAFLRAALKSDAAVNYHWSSLPKLFNPLMLYGLNSTGERYSKIAKAYSSLINEAIVEHAPFIEASGAGHLITKDGWIQVFRSEQGLAEASLAAERLAERYDVGSRILPLAELRLIEPHLKSVVRGGVHWTQPWTCNSPGDLVASYERFFQQSGGTSVYETVLSVRPDSQGWKVSTSQGCHDFQHVVICLGPWSADWLVGLGYNFPMFGKRGYHLHFNGAKLSHPILDAERGYVLSPMAQGLRLISGAEFADRDASVTPIQLTKAERYARELFDLGTQSDQAAWMGTRPCVADMLPVIGQAPNHRGLWFNFGHGHQGFTLGPASGRLLGELLTGRSTYIDALPFDPRRFA